MVKATFAIKKSNSTKEESIYIDSSKLTKCIDYIRINNIKSIIINTENGFENNNLLFLNDLLFIEELILETDVSNLDISTINKLQNLKSISIYGKVNQDIYFEKFNHLEYCNIAYSNHIIGLENCFSLKELILWDYTGLNLEILSKNTFLNRLCLYDSKVSSLKGIENCNGLKTLHLERLKNLVSIDEISPVVQSIESITIKDCKKIKDYSIIGKGLNMKYLYILSSSPATNISFMKDLSNLKYSNIDINIIDGSVDILLTMPVIFKNYKHFSHKNNLRIKITNEGNFLIRNGELLSNERI
jgi:hypothetical protein